MTHGHTLSVRHLNRALTSFRSSTFWCLKVPVMGTLYNHNTNPDNQEPWSSTRAAYTHVHTHHWSLLGQETDEDGYGVRRQVLDAVLRQARR